MYYVVVDPCATYPLHMIHFVKRFGLKAIAVFTDMQSYQSYAWMYKDSLGPAIADEYFVGDWPSIDAMAEAIRRDNPGPFAGIIPWDELTIRFSAELSHALGLDWNHPDVIACFRDKFRMKDALRRHGGVRINASATVDSFEAVVAFQENLGKWPIVVKPTEGAGSLGVYFAENRESLLDYARDVFHSNMGSVLLEEFIPGTEYVVNGMTDAHGNFMPTDAWRYIKRDVGNEKNIYIQTVKVSTYEYEWAPLTHYAETVIKALGLRKAPCHMEIKMDESGPCLVEVGARFAGGNQPLLASELHGRSLFELAANHYLSDGNVTVEDLHYDRYDSRQARIISGVQTFELPRVNAILGLDDVRALPSFFGFGKLLNPGMPVPITKDLISRSYEVYLMHPDEEQIAYDSEQVRACLRYI